MPLLPPSTQNPDYRNAHDLAKLRVAIQQESQCHSENATTIFEDVRRTDTTPHCPSHRLPPRPYSLLDTSTPTSPLQPA